MDLLKWIILGLCIGLITAQAPEPESTAESEPEPETSPEPTTEPEPEPEDPPYYGTTVGMLMQTNHGVDGTLHVIDENRIMLTGFSYDGTGPDAFFYVGTSGSPSERGTIVPNEHGSTEKLEMYEDQTIIITLPDTVMMSDIVWFSVWCRQAGANFGWIAFPDNLEIPMPRDIGRFSELHHEVRSGEVTVLDHKTILIRDFYYDGEGPDAYFYVGEGDMPSAGNTIIPNEEGSMEKLGEYTGQTITLTLPPGITVHTINWISVWCESVSVDFGNVMIPDNLLVPVNTHGMMPEPMDPPYYGTTVGMLMQTNHGVSGTLHVIDGNRIMLTGFSYDGTGPDAYFYVGISGTPSEDGMIVPNEHGSTQKLEMYDDQTLVLMLPSGVVMGDIVWFSVWCVQAGANFGWIEFPDDLEIPMPRDIGEFSRLEHGVRSGEVTILDHKRILIRDFHYDGQGPDAYFYVGMGAMPSGGNTIVPNERGSMEKLDEYTGQTITLTLPPGITVHNIDWISVWCESVSVDFGNVMIPDNLLVPVNTDNMMDGPSMFMGVFLGEMRMFDHDVSGTVYIVTEKKIRIHNFNYDGDGPDAFFWVGFTGTNAGATPDKYGTIINNERGRQEVLMAYDMADIVLTLPEGRTVYEIMWLSVWCRRFEVDFGSVLFPEDLGSLPTEMTVEEGFSELHHEVRSGAVTFLDERRVHIMGLHYDGEGPDAFFWIGTGSPDTMGWQIPNEVGSMMKLSAYSGQDITLTLPMGYTWYDVDYLSIWCRQAVVNFGHVMVPDFVWWPPYVEMEESLENCQQLHDYFQVSWEIIGDYIYYEFAGALEGDDGYMSFGRSGSSSRSAMIGADVFVAYWKNGEGVVDDYTLTAYAQCTVNDGQGACPDTIRDGQNNAEILKFRQQDGFSFIKFRRPLQTGDNSDLDTPANGQMYIVWAMGFLGNDGRATKHNLRLTVDTELEMGDSCTGLVSRDTDEELEPWKQKHFMDETRFNAQIGPAGGERGYKAITQSQSWGIAWWINGYIIPRITMERNKTYTFTVEGGNDPSNNAKYHPFYLTSDPEGGYAQKSDADKARETIYAGVDAWGQPTAAGRYCEWRTINGPDRADDFEDFMDYKNTLMLDCDPNGQAATLTFTPTRDTPDRIYYQCYTHKYLGWEIEVVDEIITAGANTVKPIFVTIVTVFSLLLSRLFT